MSKKGHNSGDTTGVIDKDKLQSFIKRIEHLEYEKKAAGDAVNEVYNEAKTARFDKKVLKALIALRKIETEKRDNHFATLHIYANAVGMQLSLFEPTEDELGAAQSREMNQFASGPIQETSKKKKAA